MPNFLQCPGCLKVMNVSALGSGSTVECRECGGRVRVGPVRQDPRARYAPKRRSNAGTWIIVGSIAGAGLILTIVAASSSGSRYRPSPAAATRSDERSEPSPPSAPAPVAPSAGPPVGREAPRPRHDWNRLVAGLKKHARGASEGRWEFERDVDPDCHQAFTVVKDMGASAYPYLLVFLTDADPMTSQAAAATLWTLAGRPGSKPKPGQGALMQAELKRILGVSDEDLRRAEKELNDARGG